MAELTATLTATAATNGKRQRPTTARDARDRDAGRPIVQLIPPAGWEIATWPGDDAELPITVDVCTPPALVGPEWP